MDGVQVFGVPQRQVMGGDVLYTVCVVGGVIYQVRDWRASLSNGQFHPALVWGGEYMDLKRDNVVEFRGRLGVRWVSELSGVHAGRAAWIVLAGPSVEENLRRVVGRIGSEDIVIGVNRGAVHVEQAGRRADYFLCADASITSEMMKRLWGGVPCSRRAVTCVWTDPGVVELYKAVWWFRTAGWGHDHVYTGLDPDWPELEYSYNTGTMALHLADLMGCNPIRLVGADFSLPGGMFHVGERSKLRDHPSTIATDDKDGYLVMARMDQYIAARKVEAWAWILQQYGVRVINMTGGGTISRFVEHEN